MKKRVKNKEKVLVVKGRYGICERCLEGQMERVSCGKETIYMNAVFRRCIRESLDRVQLERDLGEEVWVNQVVGKGGYRGGNICVKLCTACEYVMEHMVLTGDVVRVLKWGESS